MNSWIRFSMKNVGVIFMAMILILLGGVYSASNMKLEEMPNVDIPYLTVIVAYPGATPEQSLEDIGKPMEQAFSGLKNIENLYITAGTNYTAATLEFNLDHSMDQAEKDVNSALATIKLPEGAQKPQIRKEGPTAAPIYSFSVTANEDQATIQQYIKDHIQPSLATIEGVSSVDVKGLAEKKIFIRVDPQKLKDKNLTLDQVKQILLANNISFPAGEVTADNKSLNVEVGNKIHSIDDLKKVQLISIQQDLSGFSNAFKSVGEGFNVVGSTMGQLGQGVGTLTGNQLMIQGQIEIMNGIFGLSSMMLQDQAQLNGLMQQLQKTPEQAQVLQPQIEELQKKIQIEQAQITSLQSKLTELQKQVKSSGTQLANELKGMASNPKTPTIQNHSTMNPSLKIDVIPLTDIAEITYKSEDGIVLTRLNGKPAVVTDIKAQPGTNTVELVKKVEKKLKEIKLPKGYQLTKLRDSSIQVKKSVNGMLRESLLGALFAVIVTFIFLRNWRSTIVAILSIPLSIFASMIALYWFGYSLNIMTLAGMAIAVGRVVDDSIVVIENIYRRLSASKERDPELIIDATKEVGKAVTFSTFTTIAVFVPLSFVPGIVGKFFVPFAVTVVIALLFSLIVAITVVPLLSRLFLMNMRHHEPKDNVLQRGYRRLLGWSLQHKFIVLLVASLLFGSAVALVPHIPKNFMPTEKTVSYNLGVALPLGTTDERADQMAKKIENLLAKRNDVKHFQTNIIGEKIEIQIELKDDLTQEQTKAFEQYIRKNTANLDQGVTTALTPLGLASGYGGLYIVVNGTDMASLKEAGAMIVNQIKDVPGLADVSSNVSAVQPQISVQVDPKKAAENGLNPAMVAIAVREMISGDPVMNVNLNGKTTDVNLGLKVDDLNSLESIRNQTITSMTGKQVKLSDVATIEQKPGPTSIQRLNQQEYVSIQGRFTTDNSSAIQDEIEKRIEKIQLPEGVTIRFEGESKEISTGFKNMGIAIVVAILLVYLVMLIGFGEMIAPIGILFSLPFIFVGGLWGLYFSGDALGMPAMVGFLMLIGIVVTNAIVYMDRVIQNRGLGMKLREALIEAGVTRLRPILMTALATVGALLPLAISTEGGLISRSMAVVVIAGLTTSTLLTLVIVPVAYMVLDGVRNRVLALGKSNTNAQIVGSIRSMND
ncbi:efflux RND transporter permease subunit [Tepidibacillus sp. LV47]|uniref:efflux RND transporter permease subunit n=1 Tax=Tepidibacillus sp. LV47 TaxID=3398228 RepID=UPI003AAFB59C